MGNYKAGILVLTAISSLISRITMPCHLHNFEIWIYSELNMKIDTVGCEDDLEAK
jgi:hypothetical protein